MKSEGSIVRYIGQEIEVRFNEPLELTKSPTCPDALIWDGQTLAIAGCLEQWTEFGRRGRFEQNMRAERLPMAAKRGSWGVGKFYFRVVVEDGRKFELFYDRAPKGGGDRAGCWFLRCEIGD